MFVFFFVHSPSPFLPSLFRCLCIRRRPKKKQEDLPVLAGVSFFYTSFPPSPSFPPMSVGIVTGLLPLNGPGPGPAVASPELVGLVDKNATTGGSGLSKRELVFQKRINAFYGEFCATFMYTLVIWMLAGNAHYFKEAWGQSGVLIVYLTKLVAFLLVSYQFGPHSGAHANPTVSVGFAMSRALPPMDLFICYLLPQFMGAVMSYLAASVAFPDPEDGTHHLWEATKVNPLNGAYFTLGTDIILSTIIVGTYLKITYNSVARQRADDPDAKLIYLGVDRADSAVASTVYFLISVLGMHSHTVCNLLLILIPGIFNPGTVTSNIWVPIVGMIVGGILGHAVMAFFFRRYSFLIGGDVVWNALYLKTIYAYNMGISDDDFETSGAEGAVKGGRRVVTIEGQEYLVGAPVSKISAEASGKSAASMAVPRPRRGGVGYGVARGY